MKAVPQIGIVLGDEPAVEGRAFTGQVGPIGYVEIGLSIGSLAIQSGSPGALRAVEAAFHEAGEQLRALIALGALQESARAKAPGADALDEAASPFAAGERLDDDPVAAAPSDSTDGAA